MSAYKIDKTLEKLEIALIYTSKPPQNSHEALRQVCILAQAVNLLEDTASSSGDETIAYLLEQTKKRLQEAKNLFEKLKATEAVASDGGASASGGGGGASASGGGGGGDEPTTMTDNKPAR